MFKHSFTKRGIYLFLIIVIIDFLINLFLNFIKIKEVSYFIVNLLVVYFFAMYYHKKLKIIFKKIEMKEISYSVNVVLGILIFLILAFIVPFATTIIHFIIAFIILIINYYLYYFIILIYYKINKIKII